MEEPCRTTLEIEPQSAVSYKVSPMLMWCCWQVGCGFSARTLLLGDAGPLLPMCHAQYAAVFGVHPTVIPALCVGCLARTLLHLAQCVQLPRWRFPGASFPVLSSESCHLHSGSHFFLIPLWLHQVLTASRNHFILFVTRPHISQALNACSPAGIPGILLHAWFTQRWGSNLWLQES